MSALEPASSNEKATDETPLCSRSQRLIISRFIEQQYAL